MNYTATSWSPFCRWMLMRPEPSTPKSCSTSSWTAWSSGTVISIIRAASLTSEELGWRSFSHGRLTCWTTPSTGSQGLNTLVNRTKTPTSRTPSCLVSIFWQMRVNRLPMQLRWAVLYYHYVNNYVMKNLLFYTCLLREFYMVFSELTMVSIKDVFFLREIMGILNVLCSNL